MVINTNVVAQTSARLLQDSSNRLKKSLNRLSSGSRIYSPEDDAAGLAVSTRFDAEINRASVAINNINNSLSFCQTQDGYMEKVGSALTRMGELTMMAQDVTKTDADRSLYNQEFQSLSTFVSSVTSKSFNGVTLFSSSALNVTIDSEGTTLQMAGITATYALGGTPPPTSTALGTLVPGMVGSIWTLDSGGVPGPTASNTLADYISDFNSRFVSDGTGSISYNTSTGVLSMTVNAGKSLHFEDTDNNPLPSFLGIYSSDLDNSAGGSAKTVTSTLSAGGMDISTTTGAVSALTSVKSAINQLASDRATIGATMARLNSTTSSLSTLKENLSAASSIIKDVNVADESTQYARYNILVQAGTAMLAQANALPNSVLKLLS